MDSDEIDVRPITDEDAEAVSGFLHDHLNPRVSREAWNALLVPPWHFDAPNHGFQLVRGATIVGVYVAVYSERTIGGERRRFCNLAAFCVLGAYRPHGLRLLRAILAQRGFEFTDLSPSGNVVALNERLGFILLDTATRLAPNLPRLPRRGLRVTDDPIVIAGIVREPDARIYRDHRDAPAARHIVAIADGEYGYLVVRRDRRKGLPFFASVLYVGGNTDLLRSAWPQVASHLLVRQRVLATLAERRILGFVPRLGFDLRAPRAKMLRSKSISAGAIDYLYSELTLLEW